jgi:hypothetical protein
LVAHRGVDARIATGNFVARFTRQRGQAAHEGAANAQDMNMHGRYSTGGSSIENEHEQGLGASVAYVSSY